MSWPTVPIAEACAIVSGATPDTNEPAFWGGDICWATPKDLSDLDGAMISDTPRKLTKAGLASCSSNLLPVGSVLFSSRAPIGHVAVNTVPMATNQGFKSFVPKAGKLDAKFLYYWLRAHRSQLEAMGNGATFKEVSKAVVERVRIPLPPLAEQKRIAAILDKADDLRRKRHHALATLDTLLESVFLDAFGKEPGAKKESLSALADVVDCKHRTPKYVDDGIPVVRPRNVKAAGIDLESCIRTTREEYLDLVENRTPSPGDIIYSRNASFGVASRVNTNEPFAIGQDVCLIVPTKINSTFLWYQLNSHIVRRQLNGFISGSTFKRINLKSIRKLKVSVLSTDSQNRFEAVIDRVDRLRLRMQQEVSELDKLFASLQSAAFAGTLFTGEPQQVLANASTRLARLGSVVDERAKASTRRLIGRDSL